MVEGLMGGREVKRALELASLDPWADDLVRQAQCCLDALCSSCLVLLWALPLGGIEFSAFCAF